MSDNIRDLYPREVFSYFADLCAIPRISGHEQAAGDYLLKFAADHQLKADRDSVGNVIIEKPASAGREQHPLVILQAHQDMVPAAAPGVEHDFLKDPIVPVVRAGRIFGSGTSLGADDGIGIALALALLADDSLEHGPLRAVFTVAEETTMLGAQQLDPKHLDGAYLMNLDSEDDGYIFIASAGSQDIHVSYNTTSRRPLPEGCTGLRLRLTGLSGGHSGTDIHLGRANAIVLLASLLSALTDRCDYFYLSSLTGGTVRNAVPNQAEFTLALPQKDLEDFKQDLLIEFAKYQLLYEDTDRNMSLELHEAAPADVLSFEESCEILSLITSLPNGPERFFPKAPEVVETSCNLGVIATAGDEVKITLLARSLSEFALENIVQKIQNLCLLIDKTDLTAPRGERPWQSSADNDLIRALCRNYHKVTGREMQVTALHAGLETAAFAEKNPGLQLASLGPTVTHPHSFSESCDIEAVKTAYHMLRQTLAEL